MIKAKLNHIETKICIINSWEFDCKSISKSFTQSLSDGELWCLMGCTDNGIANRNSPSYFSLSLWFITSNEWLRGITQNLIVAQNWPLGDCLAIKLMRSDTTYFIAVMVMDLWL